MRKEGKKKKFFLIGWNKSSIIMSPFIIDVKIITARVFEGKKCYVLLLIDFSLFEIRKYVDVEARRMGFSVN
jgi:hypothetical protein